MPDQLDQNLRAALSDRAAQLDSDSLARLRAIDYQPRQRRLRKLPTIGLLGTAGAVVVATVVALGSTAGPAFAGWQATPTTPAPGQLAQAAQACGTGLGSPVLTDSRGPYTAAIYSGSSTDALCLSGDGVSMSSSSSGSQESVATGQIQLGGEGTRDAAGNSLTLVDGRTGAGVSAVTIERSDGSSVQATVANGWYLAWWPGTVSATNAEVTSGSGASTVAFPGTPTQPSCPTGGSCSYGYAVSSGGGSAPSSSGSGSSSSSSVTSGSASSSNSGTGASSSSNTGSSGSSGSSSSSNTGSSGSSSSSSVQGGSSSSSNSSN